MQVMVILLAVLFNASSVSKCFGLLSARDVSQSRTEFYDKRTAFSFLTRHKRHLEEECSRNEGGCRWEEVEEVLTHSSAVKNFMIQWNCRSRTCEPGTKCTNKNNDFSHIYNVIVHCADIDECKQNSHGCTHTCHNIHGSYLCLCNDGFQLHPNNRTCVDIKECETGQHDCTQQCYETEGSYSCSCSDGYRLLEDKITCTDIDECTDKNKNTCDNLQECVNVPGSYQCPCVQGYSKDNSNDCIDVDECSNNIAGCSHDCVNNAGSYECTCNGGFFMDDDNHTCIDVDECSSNIAGCSHGCVNNAGSYECTCNGGFFMDDDNHTCIGSAGQSSTNDATVIGSVTGSIGVVVLIVLIMVIIYMLRKKQQQPERNSMAFDNNCYAENYANNSYLSDSKCINIIKNSISSDRPKSENIYSNLEIDV